MRGVITMNEEYETRFLCNSSKVRGRGRPPASPTTRGLGEPEKVGGGALQVAVPQRQVSQAFLPLQEVWCSKIKWLRLGVETVK